MLRMAIDRVERRRKARRKVNEKLEACRKARLTDDDIDVIATGGGDAGERSAGGE
jgi:ribosomal protein S9